MKESFLLKISKILFSKYRSKLSELVIVFPSRRSSSFFFEELSKLIESPIWLPSTYSIDDYFFQINDLKRINSFQLFLLFYKNYKTHTPSPHSIDRCYKWAPTLLNNLDEIDQSLVNHKEIFSYLSDVKRIENWYLDINSSNKNIEDYVGFFSNIPKVYNALRTELLDNKLAYSGLAQRLIAENPTILFDWLAKEKKHKIIFIGLDSLTISQEKVVGSLLQKNMCDIFWDADSYFVENLIQESGSFLRKYKKKWPHAFTSINNDFLTIPKQIDIIGATKSINQCKLLGNILREKKYSSSKLKRVAIILPNEELLMSVLESIPKEINDINVTMGYALFHHPIASVFRDILSLYINARRITQGDNTLSKNYSKKDCLQLFKNPYFNKIIHSVDPALNQKIISQITNTGFNFICYNDLKNTVLISSDNFIDELFSPKNHNTKSVIKLFRNLISVLLQNMSSDKKSKVFEQECLFEIQNHLQVFENFVSQNNETIPIKLFAKIFDQLLRSIKLNFSGEPLKGLQIMGLLESRTIDFDEVFILSANENHLPPNNNKPSFLPFDIKRNFNIRHNLDLDSIYANHFFNLIKRPKKTHIIYDQDYSSFNAGERSRFINQLVFEIKPLKNTAIKIREYNTINKFKLENAPSNHILEQKDKYVIEKLKDLCKLGFSPSSINLYNYCKTQFYFEKILGISQQEEPKNNITNSLMGLVIHRSLELLYSPHINVLLDDKIMQAVKGQINIAITQALKEYSISHITRGKNLLAVEAIKRIVTNFIKHESKLVQDGHKIIIKFLEYKIKKHVLSIDIFPKKPSIEVIFKGHIDRVDYFNDKCRIIDYKTGFVEEKELKCNDLSTLRLKPKLLQLLMYTYLYTKSQPIANRNISTGIINLRAMNFTFQKSSINNKSNVEPIVLQKTEDILKDIICEMFDLNETFEHLNRVENCRFCD